MLGLVLAFDARQTLFGRLTAAKAGLVVRVWDSAELRATSRLYVEVRGGAVDINAVLGARLSITLQPKENGADWWKGWILFNDPAQLTEPPILRAIRHVREASSRAVVQYEGGGGTIRLDLADMPRDRLVFLADLRLHLVKYGITATLSLTEFSESLEDWNPRPLILP
ncbi:MAG: hypothetical protein AABY18_05355 [Candidatus Thermoplasmatota archaeon]